MQCFKGLSAIKMRIAPDSANKASLHSLRTMSCSRSILKQERSRMKHYKRVTFQEKTQAQLIATNKTKAPTPYKQSCCTIS